MRNLEEVGRTLGVGVSMAKPMVTNLTKSWGAVSKAQVMGWRKLRNIHLYRNNVTPWGR